MKKIVILTGAGISAESGIPTFRDAGGLWEGYDIQEVATPEGWRKNPPLVLEFYNQRRNGVRAAQPNEAHKALAYLESKYNVQIVTQNIDDLHERGGSSKVLHMHGEIIKAQSDRHPDLVYDLGDKDIQIGDMCEEGHQLRPHVVWFGEAVPMIEPAISHAASADIFIVIGTSMAVYPAASLIHYVPDSAKKIIMDPHIPDGLPGDIEKIESSAVGGVPALVKRLLAEAG